jgi:uncharacterized protein (TIGR00730 family)
MTEHDHGVETHNEPTPEENLQAILGSSTYVLAEEDLELLKREELRGVRLELEYRKPELTFQKHRINSTIVVFGGTRIVEPSQARDQVASLQEAIQNRPSDPELQRQLRVAKTLVAKSHYYEEARRFGALVSRSCQGVDRRELVVVTGGGPGIMEAANRGAYEAGCQSIGLNITLPHEQHPNPYITPDLCFEFHYFALRKMHFLMRAKALVAFPGGFGTLDELFEALTLLQTRTVEPLPVILVGREFWDKGVRFDHFAEEGTIDVEDLELFSYAETAEEIWGTICRFYELDPEQPTF